MINITSSLLSLLPFLPAPPSSLCLCFSRCPHDLSSNRSDQHLDQVTAATHTRSGYSCAPRSLSPSLTQHLSHVFACVLSLFLTSHIAHDLHLSPLRPLLPRCTAPDAALMSVHGEHDGVSVDNETKSSSAVQLNGRCLLPFVPRMLTSSSTPPTRVRVNGREGSRLVVDRSSVKHSLQSYSYVDYKSIIRLLMDMSCVV